MPIMYNVSKASTTVAPDEEAPNILAAWLDLLIGRNSLLPQAYFT